MAQSLTLDPPNASKRYLTYEEFLALDGDPHVEWVDGEVVSMPSVGEIHNEIGAFLIALLRSVVADAALGRVFYDPFNIKLAKRGRAPDISVVLAKNLGRVRKNFLEGPPDLAIEVVSPGSEATDRGPKYQEYEEAGIPEYWLIDPDRQIVEFYVLNADGRYGAVRVGDWFASSVVPGLKVRVGWFWLRPAIVQALAEMAQA